jgi:flagellar motor switch protein FliG
MKSDLIKNQKHFEKAIADYSEAIRIDPDNIIYYKNRGCGYYQKGEYDLAVADFRMALSFLPYLGKQIARFLEDEDPERAGEIKKRIFVFDDIVMLDDHALMKVIPDLDSQELAKALKSADGKVQDAFFRNMSGRAAGMLKKEMEAMEPVSVKDTEEARQKIASIVLQLEDAAADKIILSMENEDPEPAGEIKRRGFAFEDIVLLDDSAIQKVMQEVDSQELAIALKSVDPEVQNKIFRNMSKRAAEMLKEDMEYKKPLRFTERKARQNIVTIILQLASDDAELKENLAKAKAVKERGK